MGYFVLGAAVGILRYCYGDRQHRNCRWKEESAWVDVWDQAWVLAWRSGAMRRGFRLFSEINGWFWVWCHFKFSH